MPFYIHETTSKQKAAYNMVLQKAGLTQLMARLPQFPNIVGIFNIRPPQPNWRGCSERSDGHPCQSLKRFHSYLINRPSGGEQMRQCWDAPFA